MLTHPCVDEQALWCLVSFHFKLLRTLGKVMLTSLHINAKEAIAFFKLMCNFLSSHKNEVWHKKLLVHTDNLVLYYIYKAQVSSVNLNITSILKNVFGCIGILI